MWESRTPFLIEKFELAADSGGAGRLRGGTGIDTHYRALREAYGIVLWERTRSRPFGLFSGESARPNQVSVVLPDGSVTEYSKASAVRFPPGTVIRLKTGGGGLGSKGERAPEAVLADIREGYVSEEAARETTRTPSSPSRRRLGTQSRLSAEMSMPSQPLSIDRMVNWGRFCGDEIPVDDVRRAQELEAPSEWLSFWTQTGDAYEDRAEAAAEAGHHLPAGRWLWLASMSYHQCQYMWYHEPSRKEAAQRRKQDLYNRAAPHLQPPAERVEISFEGHPIPGFLRLPLGDRPDAGWPCVVLLSGLESTKEESHEFENLCLERGLATFAFDGPGQGEFSFRSAPTRFRAIRLSRCGLPRDPRGSRYGSLRRARSQPGRSLRHPVRSS